MRKKLANQRQQEVDDEDDRIAKAVAERETKREVITINCFVLFRDRLFFYGVLEGSVGRLVGFGGVSLTNCMTLTPPPPTPKEVTPAISPLGYLRISLDHPPPPLPFHKKMNGRSHISFPFSLSFYTTQCMYAYLYKIRKRVSLLVFR